MYLLEKIRHMRITKCIVSVVSEIVVRVFVVCSVGRCEQIVKLFCNYQQICEVLKDKPSSAAGGNKKKGRPTKNMSVDSSSTGKTPGGMFSIRFLSAALSALYRHASFLC